MHTLMFFSFGIICTFLLHSGRGFHLLVFGGNGGATRVSLYKGLSHDGCRFSSLESFADEKPFGGFIDGNITVCGGGLEICEFLDTTMEPRPIWKPSMKLDVEHSSLITTFDFKAWTFVSGSGKRSQFFAWRQGDTGFTTHDLLFNFDEYACSARINQSHAIVSLGRENSYWYEDEGQKFDQLEGSGELKTKQLGCGLLFTSELGPQFVVAGGTDDGDGSLVTKLFNVGAKTWTSGPKLPRATEGAASVQYQNTFILIAGYDRINGETLNTTLVYDSYEGWLETPLLLTSPLSNFGAMHIPAGFLDCL